MKMSKIAEKQINEQTVKELVPIGAQNRRLANENIDGVNVPLATFASVAGTSAFYYIMMNGGSFDLALKVSNKLSKNIPIMVHNAIKNTQDIKNKSKQKVFAMEMTYDFITRFLLSNLQDLEPEKRELIIMPVLSILQQFSATDTNESHGSGSMNDSKYDQYLSIFNNNSWLTDQVKPNVVLNGGIFGWFESGASNAAGAAAAGTAAAVGATGILGSIGNFLVSPAGALTIFGIGKLGHGIYSAVAQSKYQDAIDKINEIKAKQWQYGDNNLSAQEREDLNKAETNRKFWLKWGPTGMIGSRLSDLTNATTDIVANVIKDYSIYEQKQKLFDNLHIAHAAEENWKIDNAEYKKQTAQKIYKKRQLGTLLRLGSLALSALSGGVSGTAAASKGINILSQPLIEPNPLLEGYYHPKIFTKVEPILQLDNTFAAMERSSKMYDEHEKKRLAETFKGETVSKNNDDLAMLSKLAALKDDSEKYVLQAQAGQRGKAKALSTKIVPTLPNMRIFKTPAQGLSRMKSQPYKHSAKVSVKTGKQKLGKRK